MKVRWKPNTRQLKRRVQQGTFRSLGHAAATVRKIARFSIRRRAKKKAFGEVGNRSRKTGRFVAGGPSPPGQPPRSPTGRLRRSILYSVDRVRNVAIIGTDVSILGTAGSAHERGGRYKRERFAQRPFMQPALRKVRSRLPRYWANSVR